MSSPPTSKMPMEKLPMEKLSLPPLPAKSSQPKLRKSAGGRKAEKEALEQSQIHKAQVIRHRKDAFDRLQQLEDSMREESFDIVSGVLKFSEIEPNTETIPPAWVREYGPDRAIKMFRLAKYGQMSAKEAPVAIKVAAQVCGSIIKAKGGELNNRPLNLTLVKVTSNFSYDAVDVED